MFQGYDAAWPYFQSALTKRGPSIFGRYPCIQSLLLFETCATENRAALIGTKWDCCFSAAFSARGAGFWACTCTRSTGGPLGLALFTVLGVVGELLSVEKKLFVSSEDELFSADDALQDPICKIHLRLSDIRWNGCRSGTKQQLKQPIARITLVNLRLGPAPH